MEDARQKFQGVMHMTFAEEEPSSAAEIGIRPFQPGDAPAFRRLNEEWITRFFRIEPKEKPVLADPQTNIFWTRAAGFSSRLSVNDASAAAP